MKNKLYKFALLLSLSASVASCNLDEYPYGFYSDDNFYNTEADATSALNYAFNALTYQENATGMFYINECATETTKLKSGEDGSNPGSQALDEWTVHLSSSNTVLEVYFKYAYIAINRANAVIYNVENSSSLTEEVRDNILAEAYFLRAYCHFNLVRTFGLVPLHDAMIQTSEQAQKDKAKDMDEAYDFIIADLEKSISLYSDYTQVAGRANKAASEGMLAKVYLTIASSKESGIPLYSAMSYSVDESYTKAAEYAKSVLDASENGTSPFGLASTLSEIYDVNTPDAKENLFLISFDRTGSASGDYSNLLMYFTPNNGGSAYYYKQNDELKSAYFGYEVFQTEESFYNSYSPTDKRKLDIMSTQIFDGSGNAIGDDTFPYTFKYMDPDHSGEKTSAKPFVLRFSDVAMMYAEAIGNDNEGWVARIRARAGLDALSSDLSVSEFRNAVIDERALEFAFEGQRLYDLRRKGLVSKIVPEAKQQGLTPEQEAFYPIPQRELDLNEGAR
ncbi:MAG: RagB/SusD family nutrient uptake outer membrane protein [Rikenellaceae bacterium]